MEVSTISKERLRSKMDAGEAIEILNVLSPHAWEEGVIAGSKKIPFAELEQRFRELDLSKEIITYCADYACGLSWRAAELLQKKGYRVKAYEGGIQEWKESGYPLENEPAASAKGDVS